MFLRGACNIFPSVQNGWMKHHTFTQPFFFNPVCNCRIRFICKGKASVQRV